MARRWDMDNLDALLSNCQTISNIQFSNFYKTENHKKTIRPKKLKGKNMTLYYKFVVKNGKLHPIAHIDYPVAPNVSIPFIFDIHLYIPNFAHIVPINSPCGICCNGTTNCPKVDY